jgi:hypothetical protein
MSREGRRRWSVNERFVIGKPHNPMMERWRLLQTPWFGVYVHFIYREDLDPVVHDHPWAFVSLVLFGGYDELYTADPRSSDASVTQRHRMGRSHLFPLTAAHRITHVRRWTTTLVFVGPKRRVWGFYDYGLPLGSHWVDYRDALRLRPTEGYAEKRPTA